MDKKTFLSNRSAILDIHSPLYIKSKNSIYGSGDISSMRPLIDRAAETGFSLIQFTPIHDSGSDTCPYMSMSLFSYSPIHLDVNAIPENEAIKKLKEDQIEKAHANKTDVVNYFDLYRFKTAILRRYFEDFTNPADIDVYSYDRNILNYAVYAALKKKLKTSWNLWPKLYKSADIVSILNHDDSLLADVRFTLFSQTVLSKQWQDLATYAQKKNISFVIDKPLYPSHDSADVWGNQKLFYLQKDGALQYVSGFYNPDCPKERQIWGHAVYRFQEDPDETIDFFIQSVSFLSKVSTVVRLDHTLGLIWKYYVYNPKTKRGRLKPALKHKLFDALDKKFPEILFIAEDLGFSSKRLITNPLLMHNIPGMRCPQWTVVDTYTRLDLYPRLCVAMTTSHDNDSLLYWWKNSTDEYKNVYLRQLGPKPTDEEAVNWLTEKIFYSKAFIATITLRDIVKDERHYNQYGTINKHNWLNQLPLPIEEVDFDQIKNLIKKSGRS